MSPIRDLAEQQSIFLYNRNFYLPILSLYFLLSPFYFFDSGLPQLSDLTLMTMFVFLIFSRPLTVYRSYNLLVFTGICFVSYIIIVNSFWAFWLSDFTVLYASLFYMFNIMTVILFLLLYEKLGPLLFKVVYISITTSVILQFGLSFFFSSGSYRESLFYNNPNQLGYANLVSLAIILITYQSVKRGRIWFFVAVTGCLVLIAASLSKAATISGAVMFVTWLLLSKHWSVKINTMLIAVVFAFLFVTVPSFQESFKENERVTKLESRLNDIGQANDDNPANRGYDRIINDSEYLVFGAGEGAYTRFDTKLSGYEIHSTFGNLLFSYGVIGMVLFIALIVLSVYRRPLAMSSPLFFILLYGIAHNGIRNTIFWIFLSLLFLSRIYVKEGKEGDDHANVH
ncbi:O-antigen ligase family protein [Halobacillus salinus]|uniref:O-antigen ligase family protein n=1 Tax=Halobacillus salinus TaxID=192814 RepID=UPI0009A7AEBB|nr:O-antigen ligase family protein [Halobacillus salinus]